MTISVLSLNLWNTNEPYESRMAVLLSYLQVQHPDIVLLQEVSPRGDRLQLLDCLPNGYSVIYEPAGKWEGREEGTAVCSLHPIRRVHDCQLPSVEGDASRRLLVTSVNVDGAGILASSVHLAFKPENSHLRWMQAKRIAYELVRCKYDDDDLAGIIVGADANSEPREEPYRTFVHDANLLDTRAATASMSKITFSKDNPFASPDLLPGREIDYVFVSRSFTVLQTQLVFQDPQSLVSDHYGISAQLSLR